MRRDELHLRDILEAVGDLQAFVAGVSAETLAEARMVRWAAVAEAPALARQVERILEAEFPGDISENSA